MITWVSMVWRFPPLYFTGVHTCMHTDGRSSNRSLLKQKAPLILDSFWDSGVFLHHQTPLSLYLFLQTGSGEGVRWKNKTNSPTWCPRRRGSAGGPARLHLPAQLTGRFFKRRQKQRASPLTGKRAGGAAVSQNAIRSGSTVHVYSFIFTTCDCWKACGSPDNTTCVWEVRQLTVGVYPACCVLRLFTIFFSLYC